MEKGLGRGLSALFGSAADAEELECVYLPLVSVEPNDTQPRKLFDEEALAELADSIARHGVLQPLAVRKLSGGSYSIIAGERRWRAARLAGLDTVPCRILDVDERTGAELALVENLQREDLNALEEARGFRRLIDDYSLTQEQISEAVGKSRPAVANALRLLSLPEEVLTLVESGKLSPGHARAVLKLDGEKLRRKLANVIVRDGLSVREAEAAAKKLQDLGDAPLEAVVKPPDKRTLHIRDLEQKLTTELKRKVAISGKGKRGRLILEYYDLNDLDSLINALRG
ncbi:MAG: ParB/RepB/Spo0J family partition protein [Oscillospiraceae bacterium]|jgi:ParB family chromosome partitioning protein|nr:ParB/RepB/Spo0J family partition protein [Oscillospiraceae bacterium]